MQQDDRLPRVSRIWQRTLWLALGGATCLALIALPTTGSSLPAQEYEARAQLASESALVHEDSATAWHQLGTAEEASEDQTESFRESFENAAEWFRAAADLWNESAIHHVYAADEFAGQMAHMQQSDDVTRNWASAVAAFLRQAKSSLHEAEALFRSDGFGAEAADVFGSMFGLIDEALRYEQQGTPEAHEVAAALLDELAMSEPGVNSLLSNLDAGTYSCGNSGAGICLAINTTGRAITAVRRVTSRTPSWKLLMLSVKFRMSLGRQPQKRSFSS